MNSTVNTWIVVIAIAAMFAGVWCLNPAVPTFDWSSYASSFEEPSYDEPVADPPAPEADHSELIVNPYVKQPVK